MQFEIDDKLIIDAVKRACSESFTETYNNQNPGGLQVIRGQVREYVKSIDASELIKEEVQKQLRPTIADVVADLLRVEIKRQASALKKQEDLL
jgi:hypothetical protein